MPSKGFTCITVGREEYELIRAHADGLKMSVRDFIVHLLNFYLQHIDIDIKKACIRASISKAVRDVREGRYEEAVRELREVMAEVNNI